MRDADEEHTINVYDLSHQFHGESCYKAWIGWPAEWGSIVKGELELVSHRLQVQFSFLLRLRPGCSCITTGLPGE